MSISHKRAGDTVDIVMTIGAVFFIGWLFLSDWELTKRVFYRVEILYMFAALIAVRFVLYCPVPRFLRPKPQVPQALELSLSAQPVLDRLGSRDDSGRGNVRKQLVGK